ncbi:MAG: hypothetical protein GX786_01910 [Clostridiales bacterium]|nr:hypothetical protein [Clostridiales bacterium]
MIRCSFAVAKALYSPLVFFTALFIGVIRTLSSYAFADTGLSLATLVFSLYGGLNWDFILTLNEIAAWILLMIPVLLGLNAYFSLAFGSHLLLCFHRYKSPYRWWAVQTLGMVFFVLAVVITYFLITLVLGLCSGMRSLTAFLPDKEGFLQPSQLLWLLPLAGTALQILLCSFFYSLSFLLFRREKLSIFLYLFPMILGLMAYSNDEIPASLHGFVNWGMAKRYTLFSSFGIPFQEGLSKLLLSIFLLALLGIFAAKAAKPTARKSF